MQADTSAAPADVLTALGKVGAMPALLVPRTGGETAFQRSAASLDSTFLNKWQHGDLEKPDTPYWAGFFFTKQQKRSSKKFQKSITFFVFINVFVI